MRGTSAADSKSPFSFYSVSFRLSTAKSAADDLAGTAASRPSAQAVRSAPPDFIESRVSVRSANLLLQLKARNPNIRRVARMAGQGCLERKLVPRVGKWTGRAPCLKETQSTREQAGNNSAMFGGKKTTNRQAGSSCNNPGNVLRQPRIAAFHHRVHFMLRDRFLLAGMGKGARSKRLSEASRCCRNWSRPAGSRPKRLCQCLHYFAESCEVERLRTIGERAFRTWVNLNEEAIGSDCDRSAGDGGD